VKSSSLFDFRRAWKAPGDAPPRWRPSELELILDALICGTDEEVDALAGALARHEDGSGSDALPRIAERESDPAAVWPQNVYAAVIGAYSDIKVLTLLAGICARYSGVNLAVSDTFTASPTTERHLAGLDFAQKVLGVEVVHGVGDLVRFMGGRTADSAHVMPVAGTTFAAYQSFFRDKQEVLAYQREQLENHLRLTQERAIRAYKWISAANTFLLVFGAVSLIATLVLALAAAVWPDRVDWRITAITGGLSLAQFVALFFSNPMEDLQLNLRNLAFFKILLESYSLKSALIRFHLTTPVVLHEIRNDNLDEARNQIEILEAQLKLLSELDAQEFRRASELGFVHGGPARGGPSWRSIRRTPRRRDDRSSRSATPAAGVRDDAPQAVPPPAPPK